MQAQALFNQPDGYEVSTAYDDAADLTLYQGDNLELLAQIPDGAINLVVTSPPYNVGKEYETTVEIEHYLEIQERLIHQLHRVLADDGSICWQVGNYIEKGEVFPLDVYFYPIFKRLEMKLRNRVIWHFGHGLHAKNRLSGRYETLMWFSKSDRYTFNLDPIRVPSKYPGKLHFKGEKKGQPSGNPLGKNPSDIWNILFQDWEHSVWDIPNCKSNHPEKTAHPAQFPIELVERCVLALSREGERVLDPYAGVGSTLIASAKHGRKAVGSERDAGYVEIAHERLRELHNGTLPMRTLGQAIWVPKGTEKVAMLPDAWKNQRDD